MKTDFHLHFYTRIFFALAILASVLFLSQRSVQTQAILINPTPIPIYGWAYSPISGWISLNCLNDFNGDGQKENTCAPPLGSGTYNYGLSVTQAAGVNQVIGCAWSGQSIGANPANNLGYLCFDDQDGATQGPPEGIYVETSWNTLTDFNGMSSIRRLEPPYAPPGSSVFSFSPLIFDLVPPDSLDIPSSTNPIEGCFNCYFEDILACSNNGEPCTGASTDCGSTPALCVKVGQNNFCENCLEYTYNRGVCDNNPSIICDRDDDCGAGNTCQNISTCSNNRSQSCAIATECGAGNTCDARPLGSIQKTVGAFICSDCTIASFANTCDMNAYGYNKNACRSCNYAWYNPGVLLDSKHNTATADAKMCGWGYNPEIGWVWFSPKISTTTKPYISVKGGSIYSRGAVSSRYAPPLGRYNASYLIESGGNITNFVSSSSLDGIFQGELRNRPLIDFFALQNTKYRNVLGAIDYQGIITAYANGVNKYRSPVETLDGLADIATLITELDDAQVLGGRTFHFINPLVEIGVAGGIQINAASGQYGAGIFVVEGDLIIGDNITYNALSVDYLKEIPSLVWIVKGDVKIRSNVTSLAGTFVVLGNGLSCAGDTPALGCGQFITCDTSSGGDCSQQLVVDGSVLAKRFELGRTYYDSASPSESFVNNGRLRANPPPGLIDFGQLLPRFSDL